ncbi:type III secretion protein [Bordetella parapertussis]|uniref:Type III secretion protein n=2 Tax=Bordetella parapertussis TaxID=519 RepID=Q7W8C6_BORPA|nr:type III secretion system protein BscF [Bordetella parapertussis]AOB39339.1 type III secretion protein [Bordetella parapertussis]AUL43336.1 type III secretion protein [Bordetella parapertussis]AWP63147.1 type III secretion protein [Bordetella parapertussis]AWP70645.1 type III secretion protein [Bordetella parapertussis]AWP89340.1 type III secretion protein [Bordetella parapertussis]
MAINLGGDADRVTMQSVNQAVNTRLNAHERDLRSRLEALSARGDGAVSTSDLLIVQQEMQSWVVMIDLQSTVVKQVADSLKGVIQKAS